MASLDPAKLLAGIPSALRDPLLEEYRGITTAFARGGWKHASLDAGRFCEVVYSILDGALSGTYPAAPSKPANFPEACRALAKKPPAAVGDHSLRILIPRVLPGIYDVRNNRNVGHVGGDVVANKMDASYVRESANWVLCELVRVFHSVSTAEAQEAVDGLTERRHPIIWEHEGIRRVLNTKLSAADRTLLLLHGLTTWSDARVLAEWAKDGNSRRTLKALAKKLLVEFDEKKRR